MSLLQKVSHNWVIILFIPSLYRSLKSLKSKSISHLKGFKTISESLHFTIIALHDYNNITFTAIEVKTDVQERTASAIV